MDIFLLGGSPHKVTLFLYNLSLLLQSRLNSVALTLLKRLQKRITYLLKKCTLQGEHSSFAKAVFGNISI
jgi:hypothetical protein